MARARWFTAVVLVGLAAWGAGVATAAPPLPRATRAASERIVRVQKGRVSQSLHVYWASPLSATEVLVTPYLERTQVDMQFEIVDQKGYVGRARVHHVEKIEGGCKNVSFWNGTATVQHASSEPSQTAMVALPVTGRDLSRARVLAAEELRDMPRFDQGKFPDVGLDLDGNGSADVIRYYYECKPPEGASYQYGYCMDVIARGRGPEWKLLETVVVPECY
jgi:hypothetical protein